MVRSVLPMPKIMYYGFVIVLVILTGSCFKVHTPASNPDNGLICDSGADCISDEASMNYNSEYFDDTSGNEISADDVDNHTVHTCASGPPEWLSEIPSDYRGPISMAQDETSLYLQMPTEPPRLQRIRQITSVWSVSKDGGTVKLTTDASPTFTSPSEVVEETIRFTFEEDSLVRHDADGNSTPITSIESIDDEGCVGLAADKDDLYITDESGWLWRVNRTPGSIAVKVAFGGATDCDDDYNGLMVAVDENFIYWVSGYSDEELKSDGKPLGLYRVCKH